MTMETHDYVDPADYEAARKAPAAPETPEEANPTDDEPTKTPTPKATRAKS